MGDIIDDTEKKHSMVSIQDSSVPTKTPIKITRDGDLARIVVYEKEDLTCDEINKLLNVVSCTKIDLDKHYERKECVDKHIYTVYNILI